jgi:hypothetical protein
MADTPYTDYLFLMPNQDSGRKIYIDPFLIATFAHHIDPQSASGGQLVGRLVQTLSALAGGMTSGQSTSTAGEGFTDIGDEGGHLVRVFYRVIQDEARTMSKGSGVYIRDILRFTRDGRSVAPGLFTMQYETGDWVATKRGSKVLEQPVLRIGSASDESGLIDLSLLSEYMLDASSQGTYKDSFNLYHCPVAVEYAGDKYITAEERRKVVSPDELAEILKASMNLNNQDGEYLKKYKVYCYDDASRILTGALSKLRSQGIKLTKYKFIINSPHSPYSTMKALATDCGATIENDGPASSCLSQRYQNFDSGYTTNVQASNNSLIIENYINNNRDGSFFDMWQKFKDVIALPKG